jgi:hypothetical protein
MKTCEEEERGRVKEEGMEREGNGTTNKRKKTGNERGGRIK